MGILSDFFSLDRYTILARIFIILLILPLHEFAHGWMAKRCGDDTAEVQGRLTLNPIAHVDPIGSVLLLLTGFGWAKPVPINPLRMRHYRSGIIWTSLAGPFSNLLAALVGVIFLQVDWAFYCANGSAIAYGIYEFLASYVSINIGLCLFNLVPVPPLDGSKVLQMLLPEKGARWMAQNQQILSIVLLVLILFGLLSTPLNLLGNLLWHGMIWATNWISTALYAVLV